MEKAYKQDCKRFIVQFPWVFSAKAFVRAVGIAGWLSGSRRGARLFGNLLDTSETFLRVDNEFTCWISLQQLSVKLHRVLPVAKVFLALAGLDQSGTVPFFESVIRIRF